MRSRQGWHTPPVDLEATVISVVVAVLGLWPVLRLGAGRSPILRLALPLVWCTLCLIGWTQLSFRRPPQGELLVEDRPLELPTDGYRSSDTCRSCHPHEYETWRETYHRSMTQVASPTSVVGAFDGREIASGHDRWTVSREGDEFFVGRDGEDRKKVVLTTGSHHMQVYWTSRDGGRDLAQFPYVWLIEDQRWLPRSAAFVRPPSDGAPDEAGRWNRECIQCHATRGQPGMFAPDQIETRVAEFGIACEACHGPGEEHVAAHRNPGERWASRLKDERDPTIFNPKRAGPHRGSDVCGQCHGLAAWDSTGPDGDFYRTGFTYRPGDELSATRILFGASMPDAVREDVGVTQPALISGTLWGDDAIRVAGREMNGVAHSPCFQAALRPDGSTRPAFGCMDCHRLHQARDDERTAAEWTNHLLPPGVRDTDAPCLACHDEIGADVPGHTRHGSPVACYDCHMPRSVYGLLRAVRQHQVGSPTVAESVEHGRPNACNVCHLDRSLAWTAEQLGTWTGEEAPALTDRQASTPAGALWLLEGDAGQRALAAWYAGWDGAQAASGPGWLPIALAPLLDDPYDAVRVIAGRSLATLPGFDDLDYDAMADPADRAAAAAAASARAAAAAPADAPLDPASVPDLLRERDDRPVALFE